MDADCEAEVLQFHKFLVDWMTGEVPGDEATFARLEQSLAPGFAMVTPEGDFRDREVVLASLRRAYGRLKGTGFTITIDDYLCRQDDGDIAVVTYVESQDGPNPARLASAVFRRDESGPSGVRWLHLHETWAGQKAS